MSFYNALFGENEHAVALLESLGLEYSEIPRYRDCFLHDGNIIIYTRTGGDNWKDHEKENEAIKLHPNFLRVHFDECDDTYAVFYFKTNESFPIEWESPSPSDKWKDFDKRFRNNSLTEREKKFIDNNEKYFRHLMATPRKSKKEVKFLMIDKEDINNPGVTWVEL